MEKHMKVNKDYSEWQHSMMQEHFKYIKVLLMYPMLVCLLLKVILSILQGSRLNDSVQDMVLAYFIITSSFLFDFINDRYFQYKVYYVVFVIEMINILCFVEKVTGSSANSNFYILYSSYMSLFCGLFMLTNKYIGFILQITTIYMWIALDFTEKTSNSLYSFFGVAFITLFTMSCSHIRNETLNLIYDYKTKLNRSYGNLQIILDALPDGLFVIGSDGEIKMINKALKDMLKVECKSELVKYLQTTNYASDRKFYRELEPEASLYDDIQDFIHSGNSEFVTFGLTHSGKNYYEWRGSYEDIDHWKAAIILVRNMNNIILLEKTRAEQKYQSAIIRSISHELRTPLSAIISGNEIISRRIGEAKPDLKGPLELIKISSNLLLATVNDLIDFILFIGGNLKLYCTYFDIRTVINNSINLFRMQAKEKKLELVYKIDPAIPQMIFNDPTRLHQVLINILSNALKFTLHGKIHLKATLKGESVKISVKDTGIGISQHRLHNLSNLFEAVDLHTNNHSCGLGLHISSMLVHQIGDGKMHVKSGLNKYSKFTFYLHTGLSDCSWEESTDEKTSPIHIPSTSQMGGNERGQSHVLVVDDYEFNRLIFTEFLNKENILYDEAINGSRAVEAVKLRNKTEDGYRLILMDCQMPVMDGWEASENINRMYAYGEIQSLPAIVAHTAYLGAEEEKRSLEAGMLEFLRKPVSREDLINIVRKYIH
jgi:signal transduction histidine kinase/CheY-like chemotaxis protein